MRKFATGDTINLLNKGNYFHKISTFVLDFLPLGLTMLKHMAHMEIIFTKSPAVADSIGYIFTRAKPTKRD
jgi:hypothetical protein